MNSNYNLVELSKEESSSVEGGLFWAGVAISVGLYLMSEFDSIKAGVQDAAAGKDYNYDPCK